MRKLKRALIAGWWALFNADNLTMLKHEFVTDSSPSTNRIKGGISELVMSQANSRAKWYLERYLNDLPIN